MKEGKKLYFLSDLHLGAPNEVISREREQKLVKFLESVEKDAQAIFLVGDVFDFWFEYEHVVPKGSVRFLAKLAALVENGVTIYIAPGNHDLWLKTYLYEELGVKLLASKTIIQVGAKSIFLAHGDGLGPGDLKYKLLKKIFTNKICQWLFKWLHPDIGVAIAQTWSRHNYTDPAKEVFHGEDKEWLIQYSARKLTQHRYDFFIMGHRHLPMDIQLSEGSRYINLGDWLVNYSYAEFDENDIHLKYFV